MESEESSVDPNVPDNPYKNELISSNASNIISICSETDMSSQNNTSNSTINLISSESSKTSITGTDKNEIAARAKLNYKESCSGTISSESSVVDVCTDDDKEQHRDIQVDSQTVTSVSIDDQPSTEKDTEEPCSKKIRLCSEDHVDDEADEQNIESFNSSDKDHGRFESFSSSYNIQHISASSDVESTGQCEAMQSNTKQCSVEPESTVVHKEGKNRKII